MRAESEVGIRVALRAISCLLIVLLATCPQQGGAADVAAPPQQDPNVFRSVVRPTEPLTAEEELRTFSVPEGFEVELVAADPDIAKPMNLAFDARGRIWVTDSVEYPIPAPADRVGRDTIKVLEDTDGDGRVDRASTFCRRSQYPDQPVSVPRWRDLLQHSGHPVSAGHRQ